MMPADMHMGVVGTIRAGMQMEVTGVDTLDMTKLGITVRERQRPKQPLTPSNWLTDPVQRIHQQQMHPAVALPLEYWFAYE